MASQPYLGGIFMFAGNFAPRGYALCQGQLLSISQNAALFSILGTTYGGNGTTTFGLPDLRGRGPVGQGTGPGLSTIVLGELAGGENATILSTNMPMHTHSLMATNNAGTSGTPSGGFLASGSDSSGTPINEYATGTPDQVMSPKAIGTAGGSQPLSIRNPFLGINFIIATQGIFPTRN